MFFSPDFPPGILGPVACGLVPPEASSFASAAMVSVITSPFTAGLGVELDVGEEAGDINLATSLMKELFGPAAVAA